MASRWEGGSQRGAATAGDTDQSREAGKTSLASPCCPLSRWPAAGLGSPEARDQGSGSAVRSGHPLGQAAGENTANTWVKDELGGRRQGRGEAPDSCLDLQQRSGSASPTATAAPVGASRRRA